MTPYLRTLMAQLFADEATHLSLHTADPGDTGADELSGGSYARAALVWGSASAGIVTASPVAFAVPADTTITHLGFWNGVTFLESKAADVGFVAAGSYGPTPRYEQLAGA